MCGRDFKDTPPAQIRQMIARSECMEGDEGEPLDTHPFPAYLRPHTTARFSGVFRMIAYFNGEYMPRDDVRISPDDRGWLFADSLYEVIRSYDGVLFRPEGHIRRLEHGARQLRFPQTEYDFLTDVAEELLRRNELDGRGDATVYLQVTRGAAPRAHAFPNGGTPMTIFAKAEPFAPRTPEHEAGIHAVTVQDLRWQRCDIKTTALTANVLANQEAHDRGAKEALFIRSGVVVEGTHTNLVAVMDGTLVTHPRTNVVLPGVTLRVVLELSEAMGIPVEERPIREEELPGADELFVAGTTTEIMPVVRVNEEPVGDGVPGPVTRRVQEAFFSHVRSLAKA